MEEAFEFLYPLFEQYGVGGVAVGVTAYVAYLLRGLVKAFKINPSLGAHFQQLHDDNMVTNQHLAAIVLNEGQTARRVEDIWNKVNE